MQDKRKQRMNHTANKNRRYFFLLYIGQTISHLGSSMTSFAVVIWAYSSTGQVMASSMLAVCATLPYLVISLLGGAVADKMDKKKIMLLCDSVAAIGSLVLLVCTGMDCLTIWILCLVNVVNGFMNAFQNPASQVAVTLLVSKEDYAKAGGLQSVCNALVGLLTPIAAAALFSFGGLPLVIGIDLITFLFAFLTLLFFIKIPDNVQTEEQVDIGSLRRSMKEGLVYMKENRCILFLLLLFSVLEFMGAISFDSMYSPLLLARSGNQELVVGAVSTAMAAGCLAASMAVSFLKPTWKKTSVMFAGSLMCLSGILLFGMGRHLIWWCAVAFCGCFGAPVYQTYQTVILREKVPVSMQGRIFSLQGMITQSLAPLGYLVGAVLADYVFEPFMQRAGRLQEICIRFVGSGRGSGMGLMFVIAGAAGIVIVLLLRNNRYMRELDYEENL